MIAGATVL